MKEFFKVVGVAPDVTYARVAALNGLRSILGPESEELWELAQAEYAIAEVGESAERGCYYTITFARVREEVEA